MKELPFVDLHTLKMVTKIQSIFRGYIYRQHLSMLDKENQCALIIQNCWKNYMTRVKLRRAQEILALRIITKVVRRYKSRKLGKQHLSYLKTFDHILNFYPSASRDVDPVTITTKKPRSLAILYQPRPSETSIKREQ